MDASLNYLLHLADDALVLGQRNAEWCGHGPVIEEDIAMANISLDLIGQARLLYQLVAQRMGQGTTEDSLAYFRDAHEFRNHTLLELPHAGPQVGHALSERDYATTLVRHFLYSAFSLLRWDSLCNSQDADLAAISVRAAATLSTDFIQSLTTDQVDALTANQLRSFNSAQLQAIETQDLAVLTSTQLRSLMPSQMATTSRPLLSWMPTPGPVAYHVHSGFFTSFVISVGFAHVRPSSDRQSTPE